MILPPYTLLLTINVLSLKRHNEVVNRGIRWRVGDGKSIYVWRDAWVRDLPGLKVGTSPVSGLDNLRFQICC